jgi:hypothetical protein
VHPHLAAWWYATITTRMKFAIARLNWMVELPVVRNTTLAAPVIAQAAVS